MSSEIDQNQMKVVILKLLDKAGMDERLTLRLLRNKAEDKLKLDRGSLKVKRDYIKTIIMKWWRANKNATSSSSKPTEPEQTSPEIEKEWKLLVKVAKAAGKWPAISKHLNNDSYSSKVKSLRKSLKEAGLHFSDIPTEAEINKMQKETELKQDSAGLNSSDILSPTKKRRIDQNSGSKKDEKSSKIQKTNATSTSASSAKPVIKSTSASQPIPKKVIQYNSSDEEGDF